MKPCLFAVLVFCSFHCISQQKKLDSLLAVTDSYNKNDSLKVIQLTQIFRQYARLNDLSRMQEFADKALAVAKTLRQTYSQTYVYERLGLCYHGKAKYLQAIEAYNNGMAIAKARNDKKATAAFFVDLGALYGSIPDYSKSLEYNQQAVDIYNTFDDTENISSCYMNMGLMYNEIKNPVKATEYITKALTIFKEDSTTSNYGLALAYEGLAASYMLADNKELEQLKIKPSDKYNQSLFNLQKALLVAETKEDAGPLTGGIYSDIGSVYEKMGNNAAALNNYQKALEKIKNSKDNKTDLGRIFFTLGNYYYNLKEYANSKTWLQQSLAIGKETGLLTMQQNALEILSGVFEKTKQFDSAYLNHRQYVLIKDSVFNQEKEKEITRKQLQIDFAIKENDYKLVQQLADGKIKQQDLQINFDKKLKLFLLTAIALVLIIGGLIYYDRQKIKKLHNKINDQKNELEKLGTVKDKLFSVVSHDMRAPVNSLISFTDILDNGNIAPDKLNLYAKELKQNLSYTSALMNNLLNWAASQMQGFKPVKENVDIALKVDDVVNTLQHHLQQKNVTLQNMVTSNTIATADPDMTAAILRNLISNAIKYSYQGGTITITAKNSAAGLMVTIKDEGAGMNAEQIAAFNSNDQVQAESKRGTANEKGTGLGLLLCKTFARQMNGTITATKDETGMSFSLWLPLN